MSINLSEDEQKQREQFLKLISPRQLADFLQIKYSNLIYNIHKVPPKKKYTKFNITKKSGSSRDILAPISPIKIIQQKLSAVLQLIYEPKPSVYGFVKGKNILQNAQKHSPKKVILNIDLKDFFPSIHFGRVIGVFMAAPYNIHKSVATFLAQICCFDGYLPQGAPTSPTISNMICAKMDTQLQRLAKKYRVTYTRYADDLTFSTNSKAFPKSLVTLVEAPEGTILKIGNELQYIIHKNDFKINEGKSRLQRRNRRQEVTGLTTNEFPNVKRKFIRQIRAMLYAWDEHGIDNAERVFKEKYYTKHRAPHINDVSFQQVLKGRLDFLGMIRGKDNRIYLRYLKQYSELAPGFELKPDQIALMKSLLTSPEEYLQKSLFLFDGEATGTGFLLQDVGIVTCSHVVEKTFFAYKPKDQANKYSLLDETIIQDSEKDLAILKIGDAFPFSGLAIGDSSDLKQGDKITVAGFGGYREGSSHKILKGEITGQTRSNNNKYDWHTVSVSLMSGMSGGPVLDGNNQVIGVSVTGPDCNEQAGYIDNCFIPINDLNELIGKSCKARENERQR